jgi:uncharacterized DUF497 family protein
MGGIDNFEWDDKKAARNYTKHGVSFEEAVDAFDDPLATSEADDREVYGEERFALTGMVGNKLLYIVYTERDERIRIISVRKATKRERENYYR